MGKPAWIAIDPDRNMVDLLYRRVAENGYREYLKAPSELMDVVEEGTLLIVVDTHSKTIIESRELYEKCEMNDTNQNIGLKNVYRRLILCYGETSRLNIESEKHRGTKLIYSCP